VRYWPIAICVLAGGAAGAGGPPGGHLHGAGTLGIAVEGPRLTIELRGPAANFIGFEARPATPDQTARLAQALDVLRAGNVLFLTPPGADCRLLSAAASPPVYGDEGRAATHADLAASWEFRCSNASALLWVEAQVFAKFPGTEQLATSVATPAGRKSVVLTPGTPRVLLPRPSPARD